MVPVIGQPPLTFYYDADCGICSALAIWATKRTSAALLSIQQNETVLLAAGVPGDELLASAYAIEDGRLLRGAASIAALLRVSTNGLACTAGRALTLPLIAPIAEYAYRRVANNRARLSRLLGLSRCRL